MASGTGALKSSVELNRDVATGCRCRRPFANVVLPSRTRNQRRVQCLVSSGVMMRTTAPAKESVPMMSVSALKMTRIMNAFLKVG